MASFIDLDFYSSSTVFFQGTFEGRKARSGLHVSSVVQSPAPLLVSTQSADQSKADADDLTVTPDKHSNFDTKQTKNLSPTSQSKFE